MSQTKRRLLWWLIACGVITTLWWVNRQTFTGSEVCMRCGVTRAFSEWSPPFTNAPFRFSSRSKENAFSKYVTSAHLVPPHEHDWSLIQGAGDGFACVLGHGRHAWMALIRDETPQLLEAMHQSGFDRERGELLNAILSKDRASTAMTLITVAGSPSTPREFKEWFDDFKDEWNGIRPSSAK